MLVTDNLTGIIHEVEATPEDFPPIDVPEPEPTLDERVRAVETDVAEVVEVLFGG